VARRDEVIETAADDDIEAVLESSLDTTGSDDLLLFIVDSAADIFLL